MLQIRRLLLPTDYSDTAQRALAYAMRLADAHDAELHVLYARVPGDDVNCPTDLKSEAWLGGRSERIVQAEREGDGVAEVVLDYADEHDTDVIVMGTHGRRGFERAMLGSIAEKVVRRASCPVLTVPPTAEDGHIERILVPIDFSEHAALALAHASALAELFGAHLDVLHVLYNATVPSAYGMEPVGTLGPEVVGRSRAALAQMVEAAAPGTSWEAHTELGYAASEIARFAERSGADLIVMATHGWTGLKHFLLGSVTEKVVRHAPCPVFRVHSFGRSLLPSAETGTEA